jgi:hypothetical protein
MVEAAGSLVVVEEVKYLMLAEVSDGDTIAMQKRRYIVAIIFGCAFMLVCVCTRVFDETRALEAYMPEAVPSQCPDEIRMPN